MLVLYLHVSLITTTLYSVMDTSPASYDKNKRCCSSSLLEESYGTNAYDHPGRLGMHDNVPVGPLPLDSKGRIQKDRIITNQCEPPARQVVGSEGVLSSHGRYACLVCRWGYLT